MTVLRQMLTEMFAFRHATLRRALPGYVDGTLTGSRRSRVSAHLATCSGCIERVAELRRLDLLLENLPAPKETPFVRFWPALAVRLRRRPERTSGAGFRLRRPALALALALMAVGFGILAVTALGGGSLGRPTPSTTATNSLAPSMPGGRVGTGPSRTPSGITVSNNPRLTASPRSSGTPKASPTASPAPSASEFPSPAPSQSPEESPSPSASPSPSETPSPSESPSASPSSSDSHDGSGPSPSPS